MKVINNTDSDGKDKLCDSNDKVSSTNKSIKISRMKMKHKSNKQIQIVFNITAITMSTIKSAKLKISITAG